MTPPFDRTICACELDRQNCLKPGYLIPGDLEAVANALAISPAEGRRYFESGRGAVVGDRQTGSVFRIPTIVPRQCDGRCCFQNPDGFCTIHTVAPFGCAYFDVHMTLAEADRRSLWGLKRIVESEEYYRHLEHLLERDHATHACATII